MSANEENKLTELAQNLSCAIFEGTIFLTHPVRVTPLISAPLHGLAGWMLLEHAPELFHEQFKPGQSGHNPGACLFQLASLPDSWSSCFRFRCITWDRELVLGPTLQRLMPLAAGRPLGRGKSLIECVVVRNYRSGTLHDLTDGHGEEKKQYLVLVTPTMLKAGSGRWRGPDGLGVQQLTAATVQRLNLLSVTYGSGLELDPLVWQVQAAETTVDYSSWRWESPQRFSHTQKSAIKLSGVSGFCRVGEMSPALINLLTKASLIHIGKHTADGCGRMGLMPASLVRIRLK